MRTPFFLSCFSTLSARSTPAVHVAPLPVGRYEHAVLRDRHPLHGVAGVNDVAVVDVVAADDAKSTFWSGEARPGVQQHDLAISHEPGDHDHDQVTELHLPDLLRFGKERLERTLAGRPRCSDVRRARGANLSTTVR